MMSCVFDLSAYENRIAVVTEKGERFYYRDVMRIYNEIGSCFGSTGKKLVMILAKNNIETIAGYLAAIQGGHAAMLVEADLDQELLNNLLSVYRPAFLWGPKKNQDKAIFGYKNYGVTGFAGTAQTKLHSALSVLLSTSGSTGSPKLVRLTGSNIIANARSIAAYLDLDETERPAANLPIHYSYGLSVINSHLLVGATLLLTDTPLVKSGFWDFFKKESATSLAGVPYTYELLKRIGFFKMELPSLRYMTQAGGKLSNDLVREFAGFAHKKNFPFYIMYGATEATARISYLLPEYNLKKVGSIGKAIPQGQLRLLDEAGNVVVKPYTEGELVYEGPNVMMGYASCRQDLVKGDELCGVLPTGDLAYFDEDGFYYITGRKSRFLKILGKRISLSEVEGHLQARGFDCLCGGKDDLFLVACSQEAAPDKQKEVFNKIKTEVVLKYKIPVDLINVFSIQQVPRNSAGKINYQKIFS